MKKIKRQSMPKEWPVARKGSTFVIGAKAGEIPILIVLRDIMKVVKDRRECKKAFIDKKIEVNSKIITDVRHGLNLFDVIGLPSSKKYYRLIISEKGKYDVIEIPEKEADKKIVKVLDKKVLRGKKNQLNLYGGVNFISDIKCKPNDSVLIDVKNKKISKCIEMKKGARVFVFDGKHLGIEGTIENIDLEKKMVLIKNKDKEFSALIKQIVVTE